jgi:ribosomal 30S subunit maturation factor RimM
LNPSIDEQGWVQVARIIRPRGNKGEVLAELFTDFPARLSSRLQIFLRHGQGEPRAIRNMEFFILKVVPRLMPQKSSAGSTC